MQPNYKEALMYKENRQKFIEYFSSGEKDPDDFSIGVELEMFVFDTDNNLISYDSGIYDLLCELKSYFSKPSDSEMIIDGQHMGYVGTIDPKDFGLEGQSVGISVTLEPASQFELSVGPAQNAHDAAVGLEAGITLCEKAAKDLGKDWIFVMQGYNPVYSARELPLINKKRYHLMNENFKKTGQHGIDMMRGSASTQISVDYSSEKDFIEKIRLAYLLGPALALLFDNAKAPLSSDLHDKRMVRSYIWRDTDPARCGIIPHLFDDNFSYASYADWLMDTPAILYTSPKGKTIDTEDKTIGELISLSEISKKDIEHYISMVFPDTRLKKYVEIRDVDSLPLTYVSALVALCESIFYSADAKAQVFDLVGKDYLSEEAVYESRSSVMKDGFFGKLYGRDAHEFLDSLYHIALKASDDSSKSYLSALEPLLTEGKTVYEYLHKDEKDIEILDPNKEFIGLIQKNSGDAENIERMKQALRDNPYAQRSGQPLVSSYTPKIYSASMVKDFECIAEKTHEIMCKASKYYREHEDFRALFNFDPELEELILLDTGYSQVIPLSRVDIFYNEKTGEWKYCELNTDGSSGVAFQQSADEALMHSESFKEIAQKYKLTSFSLVQKWAKVLTDCYTEYAHNKNLSTDKEIYIAVVDYKESVMRAEVKLYKELFESIEGFILDFVDIRNLKFIDGKLCDKENKQIDCVWRRAVTSEMFEKFDDGAQALIDAAKTGSVCLVGGFITHPAAVKEFLPILASDIAQNFLSEEEHAFIKEHTPLTLELNANFKLEQIDRSKQWIIKPSASYGGQGVYASKDFSDEDFTKLIKEKRTEGGYIIQEYIEPYKTPAYQKEGQGYGFIPHNNLVGLYVFGDDFSGIYSRIGTQAIITSHSDQKIVPTFIA